MSYFFECILMIFDEVLFFPLGAWETTDLSQYQDDPVVSTRVVLSHPNVSSEELPGSVPDLREEVQRRRPCNIHNTLLDQDKNRREFNFPVTSPNLNIA